MIVNLLKYAITLTLGIIIGFFLIETEQTPANIAAETIDDSCSIEVNAADVTHLSPPVELKALEVVNNSEKLKNIITEQQHRIKQLERALSKTTAQIIDNTSTPKADTQESIQTITMKDFESKIQNQFVDRFKGYAIEIEEKQLEDFRRGFDSNSEKSQWSAEYENSINEFLTQADPNNLHYVEEVSCNTSMCRLKIQSGEADNWQQVYSEMTRQKWFESITLKEPSLDPNYFVYYIPKPQNRK